MRRKVFTLSIFFFFSFSLANASKSPMWRHLNPMTYDLPPVREGNYLWFTVFSGGVVKYDIVNNTYQLIDCIDMPAWEYYFEGVGMDSTGKKWFLNYTNLLSYDGFNWTKVYTEDPNGSGPYSMNVLPDGEIWLTCYPYLKHFNGSSWENIYSINGIVCNRLLNLNEYTPMLQDHDTVYLTNWINHLVRNCADTLRSAEVNLKKKWL